MNKYHINLLYNYRGMRQYKYYIYKFSIQQVCLKLIEKIESQFIVSTTKIKINAYLNYSLDMNFIHSVYPKRSPT